MAHGPYIVACFAITAVGMAWLALSSYLSMRRSEALADDLRNRD
jgi:heme exporter protein CcmD